MMRTGTIFLQGYLKPTKTILTQRSLLSSFALRSTKESSSIGYTLRRYQSELVGSKIESKSIEIKKTEQAENKTEPKSTEPKPAETSTTDGKPMDQSDNRITKDGKYKPPVNTAFKGTYKGDYERIIKYTLIPLTAIPFYTSYAGIALHPMIDATIAVSFLWYCHYGFSSLIIDKIPKDKYSKTHKVSMWSLYTATFLSMCGIYELETENNGVVDLIKGLWNDDESNIYVFGK